MADGAAFSFDSAAIDAEADRVVRQHLAAATDAVGGATKALERRLEAAGQQAGMKGLAKAFSSQAYPKRGPARNPVGEVFLNGRARTYGAFQFFTQPGQVRGTRGQYLAVPLPAAGSRGRLRDLTPSEWERRTGIKLRFVARPGKTPLLVADNATLGGRGVARATRQRQQGPALRRTATVPVFVLIPLVKHRNSLAVKPLVDQSEADMVQRFLAASSST